jgi:hypothetical protein
MLSRRTCVAFCYLVILGVAVAPLQASAHPLLSAVAGAETPARPNPLPNLATFIEQVRNGAGDQVTGIYIPHILSNPVVQQPGGQPAFVSPEMDQITQFGLASSYNSLGFLAHNDKAGSKFTQINAGNLIAVIYGDGHYLLYQVTQILQFQALQPFSPYSEFLDLSNNQQLNVQAMFDLTYGVNGRLVMQTCIASQGIDSWGRLFIIASPYSSVSIQGIFQNPLAVIV